MRALTARLIVVAGFVLAILAFASAAQADPTPSVAIAGVPSSVIPGQTVTADVTVTNDGATTSSSQPLSVSLGCTFYQSCDGSSIVSVTPVSLNGCSFTATTNQGDTHYLVVSCTVPALSAGQGVEVDVTYKTGGYCASDGGDSVFALLGNGQDDTVSFTDCGSAPGDVSLAVSPNGADDITAVTHGTTATWTATLTNNAGSAVTDVGLDTFQSGPTNENIHVDPSQCLNSTPDADGYCDFGGLAAHGVHAITYTKDINDWGIPGADAIATDGFFVDLSVLSSSDVSAVPSSGVTQLVAVTDGTTAPLTLSSQSVTAATGTTTWRFTLNNAGPDAASSADVWGIFDADPGSYTMTSSDPSFSCTPSGMTFDCPYSGALSTGATTFTLTFPTQGAAATGPTIHVKTRSFSDTTGYLTMPTPQLQGTPPPAAPTPGAAPGAGGVAPAVNLLPQPVTRPQTRTAVRTTTQVPTSAKATTLAKAGLKLTIKQAEPRTKAHAYIAVSPAVARRLGIKAKPHAAYVIIAQSGNVTDKNTGAGAFTFTVHLSAAGKTALAHNHGTLATTVMVFYAAPGGGSIEHSYKLRITGGLPAHKAGR